MNLFTKTETLDQFLQGWDNWSDELYEALYEELAIELLHEWIATYGDQEEAVVARFATILGMKYGVDAADLYNLYMRTT